jgi:tetratricopeptide (TPR) repeat protein
VGNRVRDVVRAAVVVGICGLSVAGCAPKTVPAVPSVPTAPRHPEFVYPRVPDGTDPMLATRVEAGWRHLQADSFRTAEREFEAVLAVQPSLYAAEAGLGYAELAQRNPKAALARFDRALKLSESYSPALAGRGQALLELERDGEALASFEAAIKADASLSDLQGRIEVLRFRALQRSLERAKQATGAGRWDEARAAYAQAIAASPESAFLYRDLALVERKAGVNATALEHFRKAVSLDANDARSHAQIAMILEEQGDLAGALAEYERARDIDRTEVDEKVVNRLRDAIAVSRLPAEYQAIPTNDTVTRADIAALIAVRLAPLLTEARLRQAVITDARSHWAQQWIGTVVRAGIMDTQPNYTFQPSLRVRRTDLAQTVARILGLVATRKPEAAKAWKDARPSITDVPPLHLSYPAVAQAVASGVMPLGSDGTFRLLQPVSGADAVAIIGRLEALIQP